ncbi:hypothetical protein F5J12DRAFT_358766 [Pisolithus orientalis]|uniref:uncharacterized protein n=1 Tax=Pisolithus orientalis TaxID=936130 RepID=UPI0022240DE0|nr:uncharacterized protein F5J12DRAFT_358766 [Pisolithus orientalis]KAI5996517.1 hypothetical protein F5J12DRAFT_358766 [Pisolithus orientalis]
MWLRKIDIHCGGCATPPSMNAWRRSQILPSCHIHGRRTNSTTKVSTRSPAVATRTTRCSRSSATLSMGIMEPTLLGRTVCVEKFSSAELDESIRSMFAWYHNAHICIVYTGQTQSLLDLAADHCSRNGGPYRSSSRRRD